MFPLEKSIFFKIDFNYSVIANCCLFFGDTYIFFKDAAWKSLEVRLTNCRKDMSYVLYLIFREKPQLSVFVRL